MNSILQNRALATTVTFVLTGLFILIEYLNGAVVSHHLLARKDLPAISNWWGLLTVPLLTWGLCSLIDRRNNTEHQSIKNLRNNNSKTRIRFLSALIFGIAISVLWELGLESVLQYIILIPLVVSLFKPVHFPECLLGFVIGLIFTFGGVLPIIVGLVLLVICFIINSLIKLLVTKFA